MSGNHFFVFQNGNGKTKKAFFLVVRTETENTRNHSPSSGQGREMQEPIPIVWDGNGKTNLLIPPNETRAENLKVQKKNIFYKLSSLFNEI